MTSDAPEQPSPRQCLWNLATGLSRDECPSKVSQPVNGNVGISRPFSSLDRIGWRESRVLCSANWANLILRRSLSVRSLSAIAKGRMDSSTTAMSIAVGATLFCFGRPASCRRPVRRARAGHRTSAPLWSAFCCGGECEYTSNIDHFRNQRTFRTAMPSRKESNTSGARIRELAILAVCGRVCSAFKDSARQLHEANRAKEVSSCDSAERSPLRCRNFAWARKLLRA